MEQGKPVGLVVHVKPEQGPGRRFFVYTRDEGAAFEAVHKEGHISPGDALDFIHYDGGYLRDMSLGDIREIYE